VPLYLNYCIPSSLTLRIFAGTRHALTELMQNNETHFSCSNAVPASSKVNVTLQQAMKAQMGSRGTALFFL
jgi:hypothetical protein